MRDLIKKVLKEETEDLKYIDTYWSDMKKRINDITNRIVTELPKLHDGLVRDDESKINLVNYSDLDNSWDASGYSDSLKALADKISHMITTGKSDGVKRMLEKISTGRIKSLSKPSRGRDSEFLGRGHFRWNDQAYKLTNKEIQRVKEFFGL
jgi:hypothetical protein